MVITSRVQTARTLREELKAYLLQASEEALWKDFFEDSTGQLLLDILVGISDLLMFKVQTRSREAYLPTAVAKSSVYLLAQMVGYNPNRKRHAYGMLRGRIRGIGAISDFVLKQGTVLDTDIPLVISQDVFVTEGTHTIQDIPVRQGVWEDILFSNSPEDAQALYASNAIVESFDSGEWKQLTVPGTEHEIDQFAYQVFVNGEKMHTIDKVEIHALSDTAIEKVTTLPDEEQTHYVRNFPSIILDEQTSSRTSANSIQVRTDFRGGVLLIFGDGVFGYQLQSTDHVLFRYLRTQGKQGEFSSGVPCGDYLTLSGDSVELTTQTAITGGANEDSVEKVRSMGLRFFSTQGRMVTEVDHDIMVQTYPGVVDARCWRLDGGCCQVAVCPVKEDFSTWTPLEIAALLQYLEDYKMVSSELVFHHPVQVPLHLQVVVTSRLEVSVSTLTEKAEEILQESLGKLEEAFSSLQFVDALKDAFPTQVVQVALPEVNQDNTYPDIILNRDEHFVLGSLAITEVTA